MLISLTTNWNQQWDLGPMETQDSALYNQCEKRCGTDKGLPATYFGSFGFVTFSMQHLWGWGAVQGTFTNQFMDSGTTKKFDVRYVLAPRGLCWPLHLRGT